MKRRSRSLALMIAFAAILLLTLPAVLMGKERMLNGIRAYVPNMPAKAEEKPDRWTFSADRLTTHHTSEYIEAEGNCTLALGDNLVRADFARYYRETGWVLLRGNISAKWEGDFLEADEAEFDLNNMIGWLKNGRAFMAKPHVYVDSDYIERRPGGSYRFKNARVTRCSGETPAWSVATAEGDVTLDGSVRLYHSTVNIKDIPAAYLPYASIPAMKGRQSGFLFPEVGSSKRLGFRLNMGYYWVIDEEKDMTFTEHFMSNRGLMQGVELRHTEDENSKGLWQANWLMDSERASSESDEDKIFDDDGLSRPNQNRWWVRGKYDGWLISPKWKTLVDLDLVSDQNYLREFNTGRDGFDTIRDEFLDEFGRDLDDADSLIRTSSAYVSRSWDRVGVAGKLEYNENLEYMNGNNDQDKNPTVQTLPELDAFAWKDSIPGTPLDLNASLKYDYFQRNYGDSGHRLDFRPEISLPLASKYVTIIPRAKLYATYYNTKAEYTGEREISRFKNEDGKTKDGSQSRFALESGLSMFSEVSRVYQMEYSLAPTSANAGQSVWRSLKHAIIPRVEYSYRQGPSHQDRLPYYDTRDRLYSENLTTYSLTNVLSRRKETVKLRGGDNGDPVPYLDTDYLDFMDIRLEQSYDRNEATRDEMRDRYERRPFSDIMAEVIVRPDNFLDVVLRTWWSPYLQKITQHEGDIRVHDDELGEAYVGLDLIEPVDEYKRYQDDRMAVGKIGGSLVLAKNLSLTGEYRYDFADGSDLKKMIRLNFIGECYNMYLGFSQTPGDDSFEVGFDIIRF